MKNKIIDIEEKRTTQEYEKEIEALKRELKAAMMTVTKLMKDVSEKNERLKSMEGMVTAVIPVVKKEEPVVRIEVTPEERIADHQLERLRQAAESRALTLEEVRAYDILVKNKRLSQDKPTINLSRDQYKIASTESLLQIAGKVEDGDQ